ALLKEHPEIKKIELSSHTDSRGSDSYNMALSKRRAASAVAYLVQKGIPQANITSAGYGETRLVNECSNGVRCSAEKHQANRRTMIKILEIDLD
ncbi:MAG: OmpA family protein, partial [Bacteroidota bacterium]